jgi:sortase A
MKKRQSNKISKDEKINFILKFSMVSLFVLGASIFFYPFVVDSLNNYIDQQRINYYITQTDKENKQKLKKREAELAAKNKKIAKTLTIPGMTDVKDPFVSINQESNRPTQLYYKKHNIGAIFIPAIEVSLPLFDLTNDTLLAEGATVLQGSSYPIGGENTHSVITGHTGLSDKTLFTDLTELKKGDFIFLHVLDKKLAYKVQSFKVVKPDQLEDLQIIPGKDLITLVTCTPYMINTDRLLVNAYRVSYPKETEKEIKKIQTYHQKKFYMVIAGVIGFFGLFFVWLTRKIWLLRVLKNEYSFSFYLGTEEKPIQGVSVFLVTGLLKKPLKKNQNLVISTTNEEGQVVFSQIPGNVYRVVVKDQNWKWPRVYAKVQFSREKKFKMVIPKKYRLIKGGENRSEKSRIYIQPKRKRQIQD